MDSSHVYNVNPLLTVRARERARTKEEREERWFKGRMAVWGWLLGVWLVGIERQGSVCCRDGPVGAETDGGQEDSQSSNHKRRGRPGRREGWLKKEVRPHGYMFEREFETANDRS